MLFVGLYALRPSFVFGEGAKDGKHSISSLDISILMVQRYSCEDPWNPVALMAVYCWLAHFLKRFAL